MTAQAHCSDNSKLYLAHPLIRVGRFVCAADSDNFSTAGAIDLPTLVFPLTSTYIEKTTDRRFLSDPSCINVYDGTQAYQRQRFDPRGDHCLWLEYEKDVFFSSLEGHFLERFRSSENEFTLDQLPSKPQLNYSMYKLAEELKNKNCTQEAGFEQALLMLANILLNTCKSKIDTPMSKTVQRWKRLSLTTQEIILGQPEAALSINELAQQLNTSAFHLCRVFKTIMGISIHQYRTLLRINLGIELLSTDKAITDIAMTLGFASTAHFSAAIKKGLDMSPREIRKQLSA